MSCKNGPHRQERQEIKRNNSAVSPEGKWTNSQPSPSTTEPQELEQVIFVEMVMLSILAFAGEVCHDTDLSPEP